MSLIHSAIVEMERSANPALPVSAQGRLPNKPASFMSQAWPVAGSFVLVLVLGGGAWWLWPVLRGQSAPVAVSQSAPLQIAKPASLIPIAAVTPVNLADPVQPLADSFNEPPIPVLPVAAEAVAVKRTPPVVIAKAEITELESTNPPGHLRRSTSNKTSRAKPASVQPLQAVNAEVQLEQQYVLFLEATSTNNMAAASTALQSLQTRLPPDSMLRLRAEAWFAIRSNDTALARLRYQSILERAPGDEGASINLASIESRADKRDLSRQILSDAQRLNPDSEAIRDALSRFKMPAGN